MTNHITTEASCIAAFVDVLKNLDHFTDATITATDGGIAWATVSIRPMDNTHTRSVFPNFLNTDIRGLTTMRGYAGVSISSHREDTLRNLTTVINRARRMGELE